MQLTQCKKQYIILAQVLRFRIGQIYAESTKKKQRKSESLHPVSILHRFDSKAESKNCKLNWIHRILRNTIVIIIILGNKLGILILT